MYSARTWFPLCFLFALGALTSMLWISSAGAQSDKPAAKEIVKIAEDLAAGKKFTEADAKAFAKKYDDLEDAMGAFKAPKRGQPTLETILDKLSNKESFTEAEKTQLTKIANISRAMSLLTPHYDEKTKGDPAKKKKWDKYTADMAGGAQELIKALKAGDGKAIKKASTNLWGSCTDCHGDFR
jgi:cytochrome c556